MNDNFPGDIADLKRCLKGLLESAAVRIEKVEVFA